VLDAKKEFGTAVSVKTNDDGIQIACLMIPSDDGGFMVMAETSMRGGRFWYPASSWRGEP
jgi:hypothetical protein